MEAQEDLVEAHQRQDAKKRQQAQGEQGCPEEDSGQEAQGGLDRPDEHGHHEHQGEGQRCLLHPENGAKEVLDVGQVVCLSLVEQGHAAIILLHEDSDGLVVIVEVAHQLIGRPVQFAARDAGDGLGVVPVEAVLIEARLVGGPAHVGGHQQNGDADEEEDRRNPGDEAQLMPPLGRGCSVPRYLELY